MVFRSPHRYHRRLVWPRGWGNGFPKPFAWVVGRREEGKRREFEEEEEARFEEEMIVEVEVVGEGWGGGWGARSRG